MNKRAAGVAFVFIAAFLFLGRYVVAAIYMSGTSSWDAEFFSNGLEYVGTPLLILSIISLVVGCIYLFFAETEHWKDDELAENEKKSEE